MNTNTQSVINIPLKAGVNQYPVAQGAPRKIVAFSPTGIQVWVDRSVTPGPCTFTLAKMPAEVPLEAGACLGQCGQFWVFSTCFA